VKRFRDYGDRLAPLAWEHLGWFLPVIPVNRVSQGPMARLVKRLQKSVLPAVDSPALPPQAYWQQEEPMPSAAVWLPPIFGTRWVGPWVLFVLAQGLSAPWLVGSPNLPMVRMISKPHA
jgi:hypothetical protein